MALFSLGDGASAKGTYAPAHEVTLCNSWDDSHPDSDLHGDPNCSEDLATSSHPDLVQDFEIPVGDLQFWVLITTAPEEFVHESATSIGIGDKIGGLVSVPTLGLTNNPCNDNSPIPFTFYNSTVDFGTPSSPDEDKIIDPKPEGQEDRQATYISDPGSQYYSDSTDPIVTKYPRVFVNMFDPDYLATSGYNGTGDSPSTGSAYDPIVPLARYAGLTKIAGTWIMLSFVVFEPGELVDPDDDGVGTGDGFQPPHPFSRWTEDKGYVYVISLITPDPTVYKGNPSAISDFCSSLDAYSLFLGQSIEGHDRWTSPDTASTYLFGGYSESQRDADGDGIMNGLDTCPLTPTPLWDPRSDDDLFDPDDDMIPGQDSTPLVLDFGSLVPGTGCDPTPETNTNAGNHDLETISVFDNAQDNCPLIANNGVGGNPDQLDSENTVAYASAAPDGGPWWDDIGNECDDNDYVADGYFGMSSKLTAKCIGGTDGDGDGWCQQTGGVPLAEKVAYDGAAAAHGLIPTVYKTKEGPSCSLGSQRYDLDCDGFSDWVEGILGTEASDPCSDSTSYDAWPSDFQKNKNVNIFDVLQMKPNFGCKADGTGTCSSGYSERKDLDVDSDVDIFDVLQIKPTYGQTCS